MKLDQVHKSTFLKHLYLDGLITNIYCSKKVIAHNKSACIFCLLLFIGLNAIILPTKGQGVLENINKIEKAVFTIKSFNKDGSLNSTFSGFFISPDGIALIPSEILLNSDSVDIVMRSGRKYKLERVLSTHKMANLSLIKAHDPRKKDFNYIIPSRQSSENLNEVLIISNTEETENGISLGQIVKVYHAPYLNRIITINSDFKSKSICSPVIDNRGDLIGIAGYLQKHDINYYFSTEILNDTLWINHPYSKWKHSTNNTNKHTLHTYFKNGIINFIHEKWVDSAKKLTLYLKNDTTNIEAHILRGEARRQYENFLGMRADFNYVIAKTNGHFLIDYFDAKYLFSQMQKKDAFIKYISSIEKNDNFAPSLIDFGLLAVELRNDFDTALKCFNKSIECAPSYADGYYERSRLLQQFFNNTELALEDINKAISLNSQLAGAFSIRGTIKIQAEDYLEAISDFDRAINIDPTDTHALFNRGLAFFNLGMKKRSCKDWETASQLGHFKSVKYISRYCSKGNL